MRKLFLILCVYLVTGTSMVLGAPLKPVDKFPAIARVVSDRVNVRAGQSNNYESVSVVNKDSELLVLGKMYSWYKVALPEGSRIYIKSEYVKILTPDIAEVLADKVNVRARPGTDAAILGQLLRGDRFFIKGSAGEKNGWIQLRPQIKTVGWVQDDFLEFKSAQIPARMYDDPTEALAKVQSGQEVLERKRSAKFALIKPVAQGQYEAQGVLVPVVNQGSVSYKIMGGAKGDACVAYVTGSPSVMANFVGTKVVVRGTAKDDPSQDAVVMTVTKISLAL